jgi:hypothetical protein
MKCESCGDCFWVCENHPDKPWDGDSLCCGGAGMPCQECNQDQPPKDLPGSTTIWDIHRGWLS